MLQLNELHFVGKGFLNIARTYCEVGFYDYSRPETVQGTINLRSVVELVLELQRCEWKVIKNVLSMGV